MKFQAPSLSWRDLHLSSMRATFLYKSAISASSLAILSVPWSIIWASGSLTGALVRAVAHRARNRPLGEFVNPRCRESHKPQGRRTGKPRKLRGTPKQLAVAKAKAARPVVDAVERKRRKRAALNRVMNDLKACFNRGFQNGHVTSEAAWRRLKRFKGADSARIQWLTAYQATRLINSAGVDFPPILQRPNCGPWPYMNA
jgi:hypothetical protein